MRKYRNVAAIFLGTGCLMILIFWILAAGKLLEKKAGNLTVSRPEWSTLPSAIDFRSHISGDSLSILLIQIITILAASKVLGFVFKKIRQPRVIGEILAGVILGPSFCGALFPSFSHFVFPKNSLEPLYLFSELGLVLFMFVVGMEVDFSGFKSKWSNTVFISYASILIPFAAGVGLAYFIFEPNGAKNAHFLHFGLFAGISMSITAFPVLARILRETRMQNTRLGHLAIACAAVNDVAAWFILAGIITLVKAGSLLGALVTLLATLAYFLAMMGVAKPLIQKLTKNYQPEGGLSLEQTGLMLSLLLCSSLATELIGIHALFGAFVCGLIVPKTPNLKPLLIEKIDHFSVTLLLPLFFAFSGLRTQLGLLNDYHKWIVCAIITVLAILGKGGGTYLAARFVGESRKDSVVLGALLNTRGLMELVVLNIGYELGVISPEIFTMMVIMAIVTTSMTGPVIGWIGAGNFPKKVVH